MTVSGNTVAMPMMSARELTKPDDELHSAVEAMVSATPTAATIVHVPTRLRAISGPLLAISSAPKKSRAIAGGIPSDASGARTTTSARTTATSPYSGGLRSRVMTGKASADAAICAIPPSV